ncbi:MAG TPA: aminotransferase class I/II-fold pyridoxal phosphate-dependent enzyme [Vicinamibacterales bacterium]|nr:aminotransferase class I/II-fold pyridoxal phosphate-dependent enzyme [Vicinamibacterales bacterium]
MTVTVPSRVRGIELPPFDPLNLRASELRAAGHDVISLGQALPFYGPPPSALAAARQALDTREVNVYSTDPGMPALRAALADRLRSVGVVASAADIIITAGANHAFTLALTTMVDPGDDVILPSPYFTNHQMAVVALGANPIEAPVGDCETFAVRWADIEPHITARTRAVVLCNPGNPTGAVLDPVEGERIVSELGRRNIVVFSDETYLHLVYGRPHWSAASSVDWRRNVVVVGTFSKSFAMMGWRVGFMLADASVCTEAVKIQDAMIICAPVISQMAALGAVREDWGYPESFHEGFLKRRAALLDGVRSVPRLRWTPTNGAFFGFVRVDGCTDSTALAGSLLEEAHVVTLPGAAFGRSGEGHLRLSYGSVSVADVTEAMRRVAACFERQLIN